jgi:hypothetical protein
LVAASLLLLFVVAVAAALGRRSSVGLALPLHCLGDWGVPGVVHRSLGALVRQAKECRNIWDVVGGELLHHLIFPYSMVKCNYHRSIEDMRNGIVNLGEPLDEGTQGFTRALLDDMEVSLIARPSVSTFDVGCELVAQL